PECDRDGRGTPEILLRDGRATSTDLNYVDGANPGRGSSRALRPLQPEPNLIVARPGSVWSAPTCRRFMCKPAIARPQAKAVTSHRTPKFNDNTPSRGSRLWLLIELWFNTRSDEQAPALNHDHQLVIYCDGQPRPDLRLRAEQPHHRRAARGRRPLALVRASFANCRDCWRRVHALRPQLGALADGGLAGISRLRRRLTLARAAHPAQFAFHCGDILSVSASGRRLFSRK